MEVDLQQMMNAKTSSVNGLTGGIEYLFKKNKVDYFKGSGKFVSKNEVFVKGLDGKDQTVKAKNIIIATGSEPVPLPNIPVCNY